MDLEGLFRRRLKQLIEQRYRSLDRFYLETDFSKGHLSEILRGKGSPTVLLHHICHKEIHATLSETELARKFNTIAALRDHPRLATFLDWVAKRPPEFLSRVPKRQK